MRIDLPDGRWVAYENGSLMWGNSKMAPSAGHQVPTWAIAALVENRKRPSDEIEDADRLVRPCPKCKGSGGLHGFTCDYCLGDGIWPSERLVANAKAWRSIDPGWQAWILAVKESGSLDSLAARIDAAGWNHRAFFCRRRIELEGKPLGWEVAPIEDLNYQDLVVLPPLPEIPPNGFAAPPELLSERLKEYRQGKAAIPVSELGNLIDQVEDLEKRAEE